MKIVKSMIGKLLQRLRPVRDEEEVGQASGNKKPIAMLHERVNALERKMNVQPNALFVEMDQLLHAEIKSRERLERKLTKTSRKMDHLSAEFNVLHTQLNISTVDLDLERRKNAELRKRLQNHPIRGEKKPRKNND